MKRKRTRVAMLAPATLLFMVLSLRSVPSETAVLNPLASPAAGSPELTRLQLAAWLEDGDAWAPEPRRAVTAGDLEAALGSTPRRGSLFTAAGSEMQRRLWLRHLPYGSIMARAAERNGVDGLLLAATVQAESQFAPRARSHGGALGLMQLLPSTAHLYGTRNPLDPYANLDAGSRYLRHLLDRFEGREDFALAAYNTGPEVIARCNCVPPYRETQGFVKRVLALYQQHQQAVLLQSLDLRHDLLATANAGRPRMLGLRRSSVAVGALAQAGTTLSRQAGTALSR